MAPLLPRHSCKAAGTEGSGKRAKGRSGATLLPACGTDITLSNTKRDAGAAKVASVDAEVEEVAQEDDEEDDEDDDEDDEDGEEA